jgi:hypothetical protein
LIIVALMCFQLVGAVRSRAADLPPQDARLGPVRTLDSGFPFANGDVQDPAQWTERAAQLRRQVLVAAGLWPLPTKAPLRPVIHGHVMRDDYVVERVIFESLPGHFVTGNLYRPKPIPTNPMPGVLCPHGHWPGGRFLDQGEVQARLELSIGAERWENAARHPLQARCVQLARMGCVVFHYDMLGYADSIQIDDHPPSLPSTKPRSPNDADGFFSADADARLQTLFGLQTWNSVRALDFLQSLPGVDSKRIAVTGASGGATQSMILAAIDDRVAANFACVMVSEAMQGGCSCENAPYLRIGMGNVDIAALTAPRPLGLTAANDWTKKLQTKGYPDLQRLYDMLGHAERLTATFNTHFEHNYNHVSRTTMYGFINRHFGLGIAEPVLERDFTPLSIDEMTVWGGSHARPAGDQVGLTHEKQVRRWMTSESDQQIVGMLSAAHVDLDALRRVVARAWQVMIGRDLPSPSDLKFVERERKAANDHEMVAGVVQFERAHEELPVTILTPPAPSGNMVIWATPTGRAGLYNADRQPIKAIQRLLAAQFTVIGADLLGQGSLAPAGTPLNSNRMVVMGGDKAAGKHYSGYTYGYNRPLFIERARDLVALATFARSYDPRPRMVAMVGTGEAGPWVAAARVQLQAEIDVALCDSCDFRFEALKRQDDANFVPGAVKYGGLPALLALSAPHRLWLAGADEQASQLVKTAYQAADAEPELTILAPKSASMPDAAADWIVQKATGDGTPKIQATSLPASGR